MQVARSLAGGLAGATVLTVFHEFFRKTTSDAPKIQKIGMQVLSKILGKAAPDSKKGMYTLSLFAEIISNSIYYGLSGTSKRPFLSGFLLGIGAGSGVISIPNLIGLKGKFANKTPKTAVMSFGYYLAGGIASGWVNKLITRK